MRIVNVDKNFIDKLRESGLSKKMKSLEYCTFLVIEEEKGKIIGASGIGGILNVHSLQIDETVQGRGLGKKLFKKNIEEAKKKGFQYILVSRDPKNIRISKLHSFFGFKPLFKISYSNKITSESLILTLGKKGIILEKTFRIFNNIVGMVFLALFLKIFKSALFKNALTYPPEEFPNPSIRYILKNFEKIG